jgi:hypothetical protein
MPLCDLLHNLGINVFCLNYKFVKLFAHIKYDENSQCKKLLTPKWISSYNVVKQSMIVRTIFTRIFRQVEGKPAHVTRPQMLFINVE